MTPTSLPGSLFFPFPGEGEGKERDPLSEVGVGFAPNIELHVTMVCRLDGAPCSFDILHILQWSA